MPLSAVSIRNSMHSEGFFSGVLLATHGRLGCHDPPIVASSQRPDLLQGRMIPRDLPRDRDRSNIFDISGSVGRGLWGGKVFGVQTHQRSNRPGQARLRQPEATGGFHRPAGRAGGPHPSVSASASGPSLETHRPFWAKPPNP